MPEGSVKIHPYQTPFGELILGDWEGSLCLCDWRYRKKRTAIDRRVMDSLKADYLEEETPLHREAGRQLEVYFRKDRREFALPVALLGTVFQKKVWHALLDVPYGETLTYAGLSERLGDPDAIRAVAAANGANALAIIVPCHRVIGSRGELTGYAGGLRAKRALLELEGGTGQMEMVFS